MPDPKADLYFIAIVPPSSIADVAQGYKEYFKDQHHSKAALNSPPHITLHMPFEWRKGKEETLIFRLTEFAAHQTRFEIKLENFGCFAPRVIFMNVLPSSELDQMQKDLFRFCKTELNVFNALYRDQPFHPHLTIAFRDLKKNEFPKAWEEFRVKPYSSQFEVQEIALLKHNGSRWEVFKELLLSVNADG